MRNADTVRFTNRAKKDQSLIWCQSFAAAFGILFFSTFSNFNAVLGAEARAELILYESAM
jgi:hypothetical protein